MHGRLSVAGCTLLIAAAAAITPAHVASHHRGEAAHDHEHSGHGDADHLLAASDSQPRLELCGAAAPGAPAAIVVESLPPPRPLLIRAVEQVHDPPQEFRPLRPRAPPISCD
jgi:hypothetical protein